ALDVHSVASFFVSRVDTEVDKRLEALGRNDLAGTAALANARAAYARYEEIVRGERFGALRAAGALVQRPLWASTGVKNPAYPETMYVDGLVAPDTVNTMPLKTLLAVAERGTIVPGTAQLDPTPALSALAEAGIDIDDVTATLLEQGITAFVTPMEKLLAGIESARQMVLTGRPPAIAAVMDGERSNAVAARVGRAVQDRIARRVWAKDESLWGGPGIAEIGDRLGWLTISDAMLERADELGEVARRRAAGDGRLEPCARGPLAHLRGDRRLTRAARARLDRPGGDPGGGGNGRSGPHPVRRLDQVGGHDRDPVAVCALPFAGARREPLHRDHRSRQLAAGAGARARLSRELRERPEHRRGLLGAVAVRAGARSADRRTGARVARTRGGG